MSLPKVYQGMSERLFVQSTLIQNNSVWTERIDTVGHNEKGAERRMSGRSRFAFGASLASTHLFKISRDFPCSRSFQSIIFHVKSLTEIRKLIKHVGVINSKLISLSEMFWFLYAELLYSLKEWNSIIEEWEAFLFDWPNDYEYLPMFLNFTGVQTLHSRP